jgi:fumarylacetoacetase
VSRSRELDATFDAARRSWVDSANDPGTDFPIQNLPYGTFTRRTGNRDGELGVAIGDRILSLRACAEQGLLTGSIGKVVTPIALENGALTGLLRLGRAAARELRVALWELLSEGNAAARLGDEITVSQSDVEMLLPIRVGNYTDFYASIHHATNVGSMFRPDNPLLPNYKYVPIGYHGRASSIVVSGTPVTRPNGQTRDDANAPPAFGPSKRLDYEMEVGAFIGARTAVGTSLSVREAAEALWGFCLVNDWSARDIQSWEYQPLGPFLSKSFATSVSPWIVTVDALEPFRVAPAARPAGDPAPLPYLTDADDTARGAFDVTVEVWLQTAKMRAAKVAPFRISRGRMRDLYWTMAQMLTHHASNGCNFEPGDLIASGTISGPEKESRGCLLERAWRGSEPLELPNGERRAFLEDGDQVIMRGFAERDGYRRIGFGECSGVVRSGGS